MALTLVYDGGCPFCRHFALRSELVGGLPDLEIRDGRSDHTLRHQLQTRGLELARGAVLLEGNQAWHGAEAIAELCGRLNPSDPLLALLRQLFAAPPRARPPRPARPGRMDVGHVKGTPTMLWKGFQRPKRLEFERETLTDRFGRFYAQPFERGYHREFIVEARRAHVFERGVYDHEHDAFLNGERVLLEAERAQPFGARALHEAQVVGVIDNPRGVGVFVIDTDLVQAVDYIHFIMLQTRDALTEQSTH